MDINTTEPIEEINKSRFKEIISKKDIEISSHALDHLSDSQRKVFKEEELRYMLQRENPRKIFLQKNGRYRVYYRKSDGYRNLIIEVEENIITIVSFMDPPEIPKIRLKNGKY